MAKGLLYFAQNSAFQHLTKIGKTTKLTAEARGLSASNVPEDFWYLAVLECDDVDWAERKVHEQFSSFRHYTQTKRKTEFFWSGCIESAIKYAKDLKGVYDKTESETEEVEVINEVGEPQIKKIATKTTFSMIGLKAGTEIYWRNDKSRIATILNESNKILFEGKKGTVSEIARNILNYNVNGFLCFYYQDKRLFDLRPDQQEK